MVVVAQLVRAPDCGSGGRRFETDLPPAFKNLAYSGVLSFIALMQPSMLPKNSGVNTKILHKIYANSCI